MHPQIALYAKLCTNAKNKKKPNQTNKSVAIFLKVLEIVLWHFTYIKFFITLLAYSLPDLNNPPWQGGQTIKFFVTPCENTRKAHWIPSQCIPWLGLNCNFQSHQIWSFPQISQSKVIFSESADFTCDNCYPVIYYVDRSLGCLGCAGYTWAFSEVLQKSWLQRYTNAQKQAQSKSMVTIYLLCTFQQHTSWA